MIKKLGLVSLLSSLVCGLILGWLLTDWYQNTHSANFTQVRENSGKYRFINPLLLVESPQKSPDYADLGKQFEKYITKTTHQNENLFISIYFRDLNSGRWTGANETMLYDPSSMLKVAVMIGYLKLASINPGLLEEPLAYTSKKDFGQYYPPAKPLTDGYWPIKRLIETMIVDSDNNALNVLYDNNHEAFVNALKELNIPPPANIETVDFMSPQNYSSIFRTLYSSTYLPRGLSEYALELLSYTNFKNGLVAGVPPTIVVSHKFGEHTNIDASGKPLLHQLHDCGIVYFPYRPYFLCVMTKGNDFKKLETIISDISKLTYQQVARKTQ